jgi:hypothetical protein
MRGPEDEFHLHPEFTTWIDKESLRISGLVQDLTHRAPVKGALPKENNLPVVANIGLDGIIRTAIVDQTDIAGALVTRFYQHEARWLGLADQGMLAARKLAEGIWKRAELRDRLSRKTIEELLLTRLRLRPTRHAAAHTKLDTFAPTLAPQAKLV